MRATVVELRPVFLTISEYGILLFSICAACQRLPNSISSASVSRSRKNLRASEMSFSDNIARNKSFDCGLFHLGIFSLVLAVYRTKVL